MGTSPTSNARAARVRLLPAACGLKMLRSADAVIDDCCRALRTCNPLRLAVSRNAVISGIAAYACLKHDACKFAADKGYEWVARINQPAQPVRQK